MGQRELYFQTFIPKYMYLSISGTPPHLENLVWLHY